MRLCAGAMIALLAALPAAAQVPQTGSAAPGAPATAAPQPDRAHLDLLRTLGQESVAALQTANLATDKSTPLAVVLLGDHVALTQAELGRRLDELTGATGAELPDRMSESAVAAMDAMKDKNEKEFARDYVGFVQERYPAMIRHLQALGDSGGGEFADLAANFLPRLQDQLDAADRIARADYESPDEVVAELRRGLEEERKDAAEIPPPGPATGERPNQSPNAD